MVQVSGFLAQPRERALRVALPFAIGQRVKHTCEISPTGVVSSLAFYPSTISVHVSWELATEKWQPAVAIEAAEDASGPVGDVIFPYPFGHEVRHKIDRKPGIVTGFQLYGGGLTVQVTWSSSHEDWCELCEIEACPVQEPA